MFSTLVATEERGGFTAEIYANGIVNIDGTKYLCFDSMEEIWNAHFASLPFDKFAGPFYVTSGTRSRGDNSPVEFDDFFDAHEYYTEHQANSRYDYIILTDANGTEYKGE